MYKIRYIGDPILRKKAETISEFNGTTNNLIQDMFKLMKKYDGVGLAAPQIGISGALIVVDISPVEKQSTPQAFVNPIITDASGEALGEEGCLSIPGVREEIRRADHVTVRYQTEAGEQRTDAYSGWMARVLQHEIDHLNGILMTDYLSPVKKQLLIAQKLIPEHNS
jgi:peptide deformylase